jgi:glutathione S-transferase
MPTPTPAVDHLDPLSLFTSLALTTARFGAGVVTQPRTTRPQFLLELYEFEGCPYCRIVREALTELDLDALIRPCPHGGERFIPELVAKGGEYQVPYLHDPATNVWMYESADIIAYLYETYGPGTVPLRWRAAALQQLGSGLAGLWRMGAGSRARPSVAPAQPLELYSFEASPYARLARERLSELELPYVLRSVGRSTAADWLPPGLRDALNVKNEPQTLNRQVLLQRAGRITVPYLVDPNTNVEMGESAAIIAYLEKNYAK